MKASEPSTAPCSGCRAFWMAKRVESTRLIWPAPTPSRRRSFTTTMALDLTCLTHFQANWRSSCSRRSGSLIETTRNCSSARPAVSRSWTSTAPSIVRACRPGAGGDAGERRIRRTFFFRFRISSAESSNPGR